MINNMLATDTLENINVRTERSEKRFTIMGVEFVYLYLFGIGVAGLGWIAENTAKFVAQGIIDSRFHLLPFISPYALVPFAFCILLGDPDRIAPFGFRLFKNDSTGTRVASNLLSLFLICAAVFLGELVIGNMWESLFGVELWNYSDFPLQVTQYAGLIPTLGYGGGAYLLFRFVYKPLLKQIRKIDYNVAKAVCSTLGVLIILDTCMMGLHIAVVGEAPVYWQLILR